MNRRPVGGSISFPCAQCRTPLERPFPPSDPAASPAPCDRCGAAFVFDPAALEPTTGPTAGSLALVHCPLCKTMLYQQKDFRQAVGCLVVGLAAAITPLHPPWTYASLGIAALLDLLLYKLSGEVVICYRIACKAHLRGVAAGPKIGAFDLSIHDYQRMLARREEQGLSGPDDLTGPPLDSTSEGRGHRT